MGGFPKGWFWRMFPRNENRNEGTFGCSPGTKNQNEGTFGCCPRMKTGTRVHSPKPLFYETSLLGLLLDFRWGFGLLNGDWAAVPSRVPSIQEAFDQDNGQKSAVSGRSLHWFSNYLHWILASFSSNLVLRRLPDFWAAKKSAEFCHAFGCHGFFGPDRWGFKRWAPSGFQQIRGSLRKSTCLAFSGFPRCSSHPPEQGRKKAEQGRKHPEKADLEGAACLSWANKKGIPNKRGTHNCSRSGHWNRRICI